LFGTGPRISIDPGLAEIVIGFPNADPSNRVG
jgi:hypothetical protein